MYSTLKRKLNIIWHDADMQRVNVDDVDVVQLLCTSTADTIHITLTVCDATNADIILC